MSNTINAKCKHQGVEHRTGGFSGPVSARNENRRAHGGICVTERCVYCGALRDTNRNQGHVEVGDHWYAAPAPLDQDAAFRAAQKQDLGL